MGYCREGEEDGCEDIKDERVDHTQEEEYRGIDEVRQRSRVPSQ